MDLPWKLHNSYGVSYFHASLFSAFNRGMMVIHIVYGTMGVSTMHYILFDEVEPLTKESHSLDIQFQFEIY